MTDVIHTIGNPKVKRFFNPEKDLVSYDYINFRGNKAVNFTFFFNSYSVNDTKDKPIEIINFY